MSETNRQVALAFLKAMGSNDTEGARATLAPDGCAIAMGNSHFAGTRDATTIIGSIEAFKSLMPTGLRLNVKTVTAEGDRVVVEAEGNAETSAGTRYANNYVFVFTMENGKVKEVKEYFCSILANEVLWPLAQQYESLATAG